MTLTKFLKLVFLLLSLSTVVCSEPSRPWEELLPDFEEAALTLQRESRIPGLAVGIVHKGEVVYLKGFGVRKTGTTLAVGPDSVFQLASCSKPITATALASLVGKGTIDFDQPVSQWVPEFQLSDPWVSNQVSFADLLSHRSGLPTLGGDYLENLGLKRGEIFQRLRYLEPAFPFRTGYAYTNFGVTAAGEAAARAAGLDFADLLSRELFQPLGMASTSARFTDYLNSSERVFSHQIEGGEVFVTERNPEAQAPAGGVSSSARDMTNWMLLHLQKGNWKGRQLIPAETLARTYRPHILVGSSPTNPSSTAFYGLGWRLSYDGQGRLKVQHGGAFVMGVRTSVTLWPEEDLGIVVLSNAFPSGLPEALTELFFKGYRSGDIDLELGRTVQEKVAQAILDMGETPTSAKGLGSPPPLPLGSYEGDYINGYYGVSRIVQKNSGLEIILGERRFPLRHASGDTFVAQVKPHTFEDLVNFQVQFCRDSNGRISGFHQSGLQGPNWFKSSL